MCVCYLLLQNKITPDLAASHNEHYFTVFVGRGFGSVLLSLARLHSGFWWGCALGCLPGLCGAAVEPAPWLLMGGVSSSLCGPLHGVSHKTASPGASNPRERQMAQENNQNGSQGPVTAFFWK